MNTPVPNSPSPPALGAPNTPAPNNTPVPSNTASGGGGNPPPALMALECFYNVKTLVNQDGTEQSAIQTGSVVEQLCRTAVTLRVESAQGTMSSAQSGPIILAGRVYKR